MKNTKTTSTFGLFVSLLLIAFSSAPVSAQALHVDSVSVDSVWSSDSSWTDGGVAQSRQSRDCRISFIPQGEGMSKDSISISLDSGKTFLPPSDSFKVLGYILYSPLASGIKARVTVRVLGTDRPNVAFRVTGRQEAPVIAGFPKTTVLGPAGALTAGADAHALLSIHLAGDSTSYGYSTIAKVYWDALGDGTIDDSTSGTTAQSWTWQTKVPTGAAAQTATVIAHAVDYNGLSSGPETLTVQFGLHRQIVMKDIPAGSFQMGEADISDTVHSVTLSAFAMQETPVTQEQYLAVRGANPAHSLGDVRRPVENVSWFDAVLFCNALSKLSSLDTCYAYTTDGATDAVCDFSKKGYRLPTEAEWEYACRGNTTTTYWWGPDSNGLGASVFTAPYGAPSTMTVAGSLAANGYGLYDIDGNGWKWCNDWFAQPYPSSAATNPKGPATANSRAIRGGSWIGSFFVLQDFYRSSYRGNLSPTVTNDYVGFMLAQTK